VNESRGQCRAFWLVVSRQWMNNQRTNSGAGWSTNSVSWQRRRCPVARLMKPTSDGMLRYQRTHEKCSSTNCFVCYRRELSTLF